MRIACIIWLSMAALLRAGFEFPQVLKEVDAAADVKNLTVDFEFANRSDKPVNIAKYETTCSCISVMVKDGKLRYAPGESGLIRAEFDMGNFSGTVDKVVALWIDDDPADKPSVNLTVRVHIPVLVVLEPKTVKWELNGNAEPQTIHIKMNHEKPIRVISVKSSTEAFRYEIKMIEEGKSYDLKVTPMELKTPGLAVFRIETDCELEKHRVQQAFATVHKPSVRNATPKP
ncbi:MAG: DUF1573 domain-containing protein [Gloeobacteraceae cyanobacterium ES-bin-144]|nr:DUF1573 domain-containing protein [Verrucomicrobiales bacterium]